MNLFKPPELQHPTRSFLTKSILVATSSEKLQPQRSISESNSADTPPLARGVRSAAKPHIQNTQ